MSRTRLAERFYDEFNNSMVIKILEDLPETTPCNLIIQMKAHMMLSMSVEWWSFAEHHREWADGLWHQIRNTNPRGQNDYIDSMLVEAREMLNLHRRLLEERRPDEDDGASEEAEEDHVASKEEEEKEDDDNNNDSDASIAVLESAKPFDIQYAKAEIEKQLKEFASVEVCGCYPNIVRGLTLADFNDT